MKKIVAKVIASVLLVCGFCGHADATEERVAMSDKERIDVLLKQNLVLTEENARLRELVKRPKSGSELFSECMQATKGQGVMTVGTIASECRLLLKK